MTFTGHTILITGGTSGIGLGFAKKFSELGNKVIITARNEKRLNQILNENPTFTGFVSDVADKDSLPPISQIHQRKFPST
ncbi:SDR family NAD(P)-dependent oxidoreductase [Lactococcus lactis]|uniref:SDR family NAD(P)-dependent oxidoreductase n=1 Tax=Lactococcus lactis TaxID=1358 RepID=UPI002072C707|nr:SDR family NAD(P)-dependent oxidoreductase [Lactococcus lactis]MCM6845725.1 SDR family NAD(P)-dependent oxidoreductase [Lactococcus lactis]